MRRREKQPAVAPVTYDTPAPDEQALRDYAAWIVRQGAPPWVVELALQELRDEPHNSQWYQGYLVGRQRQTSSPTERGPEETM